MSDAWKQELGAAMDLERLLVERQQELAQIGERGIDDCLSSDDPLCDLRHLAYVDRERLVLERALRRVRAVISDLKARRRVEQRNRRKREKVRPLG